MRATTKNFNNKRYRLVQSTTSKREAKDWANNYRNQGKLARVVPSGTAPWARGIWEVWIR